MTLFAGTISSKILDLRGYLPQIFKAYPDLMGYEGTHPLIHRYLFEDGVEEEQALILKEVQWTFEGLQIFATAYIEDFLIELKGLKLTVDGYQLETWEAIIMTLDAEKKAFFPMIKALKT